MSLCNGMLEVGCRVTLACIHVVSAGTAVWCNSQLPGLHWELVD